ncbi:GFA family protein [Kistimonas asteriae]|uniref:GFA family protein n=1 Tax=Kistimonas asteriae TaxID=517724 RepID=UPI001BA82A56|nr:GFA family protein [Kistimonas asteriae]
MKGSCQCGNVRYEIPANYIALVACYCTECQKASSGVGTYSMLLPSNAFQLISGQLKSWERTSAVGTRNMAHFCPDCGNRIYNVNPDAPDIIKLKAGTLEQAARLVPDAHVWLKSAPGWITIPEDALAYDTQPSIEEGLQDLQQKRQQYA